MRVNFLTYVRRHIARGIDMGLVQDLRALSDSSAFEWAEWRGKRIKVAIKDAYNLMRDTVRGNILADAGRLVISTRYMYPYGINDEIFIRNKRFVITGFSGDNYEITPQNTVLIRPEFTQEITMTLFETGANTRNIRLSPPVITIHGELLGTTLFSITSDMPGATVHYTLDGTIPSSLSPVKAATIENTKAEKIYAIAVKKGYITSKTAMWKK